jgi:hypothetical protein
MLGCVYTPMLGNAKSKVHEKSKELDGEACIFRQLGIILRFLRVGR